MGKQPLHSAPGLGHGLLLIVALVAGVDCSGCPGEPSSEPRVTPTGGYPLSGDVIKDSILVDSLPPPPRDAVAYDVPHPLNNGPSVPVKKRWIWIPSGTRIRLASSAGRLAVKLPVGAKLWKEFYYKVGQRARLIERRVLLKVADRNQDNGWLLNGGWRFYTAHYLPRRADGKSGYATEIAVPPGQVDRYFFRPDRWMPTQSKSAPTLLTIAGKQSSSAYVFPGMTQCFVCHDGAAGAYANPEPFPVLAFGPHPENLTAESFKALVKRGWIDAPTRIIEAQSARHGGPGTDERSRRLLSSFRNNCLSCHNSASRSIGRDTAFVLEPGRAYTAKALHERLGRTSAVMGTLGFPVVAPGRPDQSELILRLRGADGRRRMPPAEGGLPDPDVELTKLATSWVVEQSSAPVP